MIEHEYTREIVCPYCGYTFSDSWDYGIGQGYSELECGNENCLKTFEVWHEVEVTYLTAKLKED